MLFLKADEIQNSINSIKNLENQKEIFKKFEKQKDKKILHFDVKKPKLLETDDNQCFNIKRIIDDSITLILKEEKQKVYEKYLNKCNTIKALINLTNELTAIYIDKGYITSKVFLKPQDISEGTIKLYSIEGKLQNINPQTPSMKAAFWFLENKNLNLRDLEVGIENLNRLKSNNAKLKLVPSKKLGQTIVEVENKPIFPLNGYLNTNNFGQKKTGRYQFSGQINYDNPFNINDKISLNLNTTDKTNTNQNSKGNSIYYSFTLGRLLYTLNYSKSRYKQILNTINNDYELDGNTRTYKVNLDYKLFHNRNSKINIGTYFNHYKNRNYIESAKIDSSSYDLSKVGYRLDYLYRVNGFLSNIVFEYTKGIGYLANNSTDLDEKFEKYNISLNLQKSIGSFLYDLAFYYQRTDDQLFSVNQISIGGPYSVRGYNKEGLSGNNGYYYRNELSYRSSDKLFKYAIPYIALDGGHIKTEEDTLGGNLLGGAVGLKLSFDSIYADIYYSKPFKTDDITEYKNFLGFQVTYSF